MKVSELKTKGFKVKKYLCLIYNFKRWLFINFYYPSNLNF